MVSNSAPACRSEVATEIVRAKAFHLENGGRASLHCGGPIEGHENRPGVPQGAAGSEDELTINRVEGFLEGLATHSTRPRCGP